MMENDFVISFMICGNLFPNQTETFYYLDDALDRFDELVDEMRENDMSLMIDGTYYYVNNIFLYNDSTQEEICNFRAVDNTVINTF